MRKKGPTYALDETRPPRLNFFPFNTRAGTIGTDDCNGTDGKGDDLVALKKFKFSFLLNKIRAFTCISMSNCFICCYNWMKL